MAQIYFLSVATLIFGGMMAASGFISRRLPSLGFLEDLWEQRSLVIVLGVIMILIGVLKVFVRAPGDTVPVAGDLLPAAAGIVAGLVLVLGKVSAPASSDFAESPRKTLLSYRDPIGIAAVLVGLLHFLFPAVVIL